MQKILQLFNPLFLIPIVLSNLLLLQKLISQFVIIFQQGLLVLLKKPDLVYKELRRLFLFPVTQMRYSKPSIGFK
jgi:hypothetical protein